MPQGDATAAQPDRGPISVRGWKVFGVGTHKGSYYGPQQVRQIADNFRRLAGLLTPTVKVGHDRQQRLTRSLGFPNVGRVSRCVATPDNVLVLDLDDVPPEVAGKINAGLLNSGSIELKGRVPDPRDQGRVLPGDVLTAVALLGEEQPAVPGFAPPKAVYADGTEVPPDRSAADWLAAMADVAKTMAAEADDAHDRGTVICFSDMFQEPPVTPEQIIEALAAMPPEDKAKIAAALGAPAPAAQMSDDKPKEEPKKDAPPGDAPPAYFTAFADEVKKCMSDMGQRVGGLEAAKTAQMSADAEEKDKQFSAEVARVVDAAVKAGHLQPWQKADYLIAGKAKDRTKVFSDGAAKGKTEFAAWADALTSGNVKAFSDQVQDAPKAAAVPAAVGSAVRPGGVIDRLVPHYAAGIREAAK